MDHHRKPAVSPDSALASDLFDQFCAANTQKSILGIFRHLCDILHIKPTNFPQFYPKLKAKLRSWKAQALWNKFDKRASHKCYNRGKACPNTRVLVIGGGPCGVRAAIEAQLLGAKVVVVEKRDRMSRNNVLHLWPFVIQDLRALGAKKFFGKFCAGSIDHISIRQLQCILLKVALIFGVEIYEGVSFESIIPVPDDQSERTGWRALTTPADHPVSQYEFDVLIGADGRRNTLEGFRRKEFRGKLAIAITANFINRHSEAEARVEEISGVAFIFNQKFFKDLYAATGIDLENIVYYKDETHYFVMTAKKHSLLDKGVIMNDYADTAKLLAIENVDKNALEQYAREAADFSTNYRLPNLDFAVNHYGQPDVAMFDFTSMYAAENASRVIERHGHKLLMMLVGDSLLEPFWPTGSGCARGFLSSLDACWAIRSWGMGNSNPLEVLSERESIYRILGQTTPENLQRDLTSYTLDPTSRYPNLNSRCVLPIQARGLYDTDNPTAIEECIKAPSITTLDQPKKRRRRDSQVHPDTLLRWLKKQVTLYDTVHIEDMSSSFKDGMALCAIIHRYRPDLIDFHSLSSQDVSKNNQLAFDTLEREFGISPVMTGLEMDQCEVPDRLAMLSYLSQIYDTFRGEIPHFKHPKLEDFELPVEVNQTAVMNERLRNLAQMSSAHKVSLVGRLVNQNTPTRKRHSTNTPRTDTLSRKTRKRRSAASEKDKPASNVEWRDWHKTLDDIEEKRQERLKDLKEMEINRLERQRCVKEIEKNRQDRMMRKRYMRHLATQQFKKSMQMLQGNAKSESDSSPFEDYSLFVYRQTAPDFQDRVKELEMKLLYPDREARLHAELKRAAASKDEKFSGRVKEIEAKLKGTAGTEKKPKDLLRAIGKIEKTDWNLREIEKKIEENKHSKGRGRAERVPKWSRQQFDDKFSAMERKLRVRGEGEDSSTNKYSEIDVNLKQLEKKIKEGNMMEPGKVSALAAHLANMNQEPEKPALQKSNSRAALVLPAQGGSEMCHFCNKRVYLMERLSAEGRFFHRGCFRCEYCSITLRVGNYAFDRDGKFGSRFFCTQHFGLSGTQRMRSQRKSEELRTVGNKENIPTSMETKTPEKAINPTPMEQDALDRGTTPERIEFENLSGIGGEAASDLDEAEISEMDEDEWTDRNFGTSAAEGSSDEVSDLSDSEEEEEFAEALDVGVGLTADETIRLAENWTRRHSHEPNGAAQTGTGVTETNKDDDESGSCHDSDDSRDHFSYQEYDGEDDDSDTATEDEEEVRARELRKQEVRLEVPDRNSDSGSDTEKRGLKSNEQADSKLTSNFKIKSKTKSNTNSKSRLNRSKALKLGLHSKRNHLESISEEKLQSGLTSFINANLKTETDLNKMQEYVLKPRPKSKENQKLSSTTTSISKTNSESHSKGKLKSGSTSFLSTSNKSIPSLIKIHKSTSKLPQKSNSKLPQESNSKFPHASNSKENLEFYSMSTLDSKHTPEPILNSKQLNVESNSILNTNIKSKIILNENPELNTMTRKIKSEIKLKSGTKPLQNANSTIPLYLKRNAESVSEGKLETGSQSHQNISCQHETAVNGNQGQNCLIPSHLKGNLESVTEGKLETGLKSHQNKRFQHQTSVNGKQSQNSLIPSYLKRKVQSVSEGKQETGFKPYQNTNLNSMTCYNKKYDICSTSLNKKNEMNSMIPSYLKRSGSDSGSTSSLNIKCKSETGFNKKQDCNSVMPSYLKRKPGSDSGSTSSLNIKCKSETGFNKKQGHNSMTPSYLKNKPGSDSEEKQNSGSTSSLNINHKSDSWYSLIQNQGVNSLMPSYLKRKPVSYLESNLEPGSPSSLNINHKNDASLNKTQEINSMMPSYLRRKSGSDSQEKLEPESTSSLNINHRLNIGLNKKQDMNSTMPSHLRRKTRYDSEAKLESVSSSLNKHYNPNIGFNRRQECDSKFGHELNSTVRHGLNCTMYSETNPGSKIKPIFKVPSFKLKQSYLKMPLSPNPYVNSQLELWGKSNYNPESFTQGLSNPNTDARREPQESVKLAYIRLLKKATNRSVL